jgi:hypothetical protein
MESEAFSKAEARNIKKNKKEKKERTPHTPNKQLKRIASDFGGQKRTFNHHTGAII